MINTQALLGTMLGGWTLQSLIGQGEVGVVFLAQQSRPRRQAAVKVLLPRTSLTPNQWPAFLEKFHKEISAVSSLQQQNILPVYAFGEQDGLAYLLMPYISAGTLQHVMEREGPLAWPRTVNYLDQLAAALDFAHERGILHQNVRPANIFLTSEERLLLTDFGLLKMVAEKEALQIRLLRPGAPIEALKYKAPEQVLGDDIGVHTDLYALGVILYQMVTGKTPFSGETTKQVVMQLIQASPPPPRLLRTDLPLAAEQVILQALARRPADRYACARDFASAFRVALTAAGIPLTGSRGETLASDGFTSAHLSEPRPGGLFDPAWRKTKEETLPAAETILLEDEQKKKDFTVDKPTERHTPFPPARSRLGPKTGFLRPIAETEPSSGGTTTGNRATAAPVPESLFPPTNVTRTLPGPQSEHDKSAAIDSQSAAKSAVPNPLSPFPSPYPTGALMIPGSEEGKPGTMKLTGAVKVVQVPVAGQPGRYVTGLLPLSPPASSSTQQLAEPLSTTKLAGWRNASKKQQKIAALALFMLLVLLVGATLLFSHTRSDLAPKNGIQAEHITANLQAIQAARATATAAANTILTDTLNQNIHNWPVATAGYRIYVFKDGAYHIMDNDANKSAPAILPDVILKGPSAFTLTMEEIRGDTSSMNNSFGMILRFNSQTQRGREVVTFYSFEVVNSPGGKYQFWKYDNSKGPNPWTSLWQKPFGGEFHQGQGPRSINTFKVFASGKYFTFTVNGKEVGSTGDSSLPSGGVGMLVNWKGTEVAFTDLELTYS